MFNISFHQTPQVCTIASLKNFPAYWTANSIKYIVIDFTTPWTISRRSNKIEINI